MALTHSELCVEVLHCQTLATAFADVNPCELDGAILGTRPKLKSLMSLDFLFDGRQRITLAWYPGAGGGGEVGLM